MKIDLGIFKKSLAAVKDRTHALETEIEALKQRRESLDQLRLPREDFIALLEEYIDEQAARYRGSLHEYLGSVAERYQTDLSALPYELPLLRSVPAHYPGSERGILAPAIYLFFGETFKDAMRREVEAMPWPEAGPPRAAREKERGALDKEIATKERTLQEHLDAARDAGVRL